MKISKTKTIITIFIIGVIITLFFLAGVRGITKLTSTDKYCMSCHIHTQSELSWKLSSHYNNDAGIIVHCVDCHLPPKDHLVSHFAMKAKHGIHDFYVYNFKDSAEIDWDIKSMPEVASEFVYQASCMKCHSNLFPLKLNDAGCESHLKFSTNPENKKCITCHISVGHYNPNAHRHNVSLVDENKNDKQLYEKATEISEFGSYNEKIPGTGIDFNMKAIPGGKFIIGSRKLDEYKENDEGPAREVLVDSFWMAEIEVSWDAYLAFFSATGSQGRKESKQLDEVDGISGPTPPWGAPDQGWGKGKRPAITMTHHAAMVYCKWLSSVTGKYYRLPTEAEWEYAANRKANSAYFFKGDVKRMEGDHLMGKLFGPDSSVINSYVVYEENSPYKTMEPDFVMPNAYGLKNMLGNVSEFCLDYYKPKIYNKYPKGLIKNPRGPRKGKEHVIRGGSYKNSAKDLRIANRSYTKTKEWLVTDPQIPKSIWWYSDCKDVGFRVVCVYKKSNLKK